MARQYAALRGLAIALVVLHHSIMIGVAWAERLGFPVATGWEHFVLKVLFNLGFMAVPTFFFISGSYVAYMARGNPPIVSWESIKAVLRRILFPYLFWSLVFFILVYFRYAEKYTLFGYLKKLVIGYPHNFVPLLMFYYFFSPTLNRLARRFGFLLLVLILIGQFFLMGMVFPDYLGSMPINWLEALHVPAIVFQSTAMWAIYFPLVPELDNFVG